MSVFPFYKESPFEMLSIVTFLPMTFRLTKFQHSFDMHFEIRNTYPHTVFLTVMENLCNSTSNHLDFPGLNYFIFLMNGGREKMSSVIPFSHLNWSIKHSVISYKRKLSLH